MTKTPDPAQNRKRPKGFSRRGLLTPKQTRKPPTAPGTLVSNGDIADLFGVSKRTVWLYTGRPDFPAPVDEINAGPIWKRAAVEKWGAKHLPLPVGRPRTAKGKPKEPRG